MPVRRDPQFYVSVVFTAFISIFVILLITLFLYYKYTSVTADVGLTSNYIVVIDAGSGHTALYVYQWSDNVQDERNGVLRQQKGKICETRGLTNYQDFTHIGKQLRKCINSAVKVVPSNQANSTNIYVGGTAGLRMLRSDNETAANQILNAVEEEIRNQSNFRIAPNSFRILTGSEEGYFGWTTANYLTHAFEKNSTYGVLHLGGGSTQITFEPQNQTTSEAMSPTVSTDIFGEEYRLYSHSFLCHGLKEAGRAFLAMLASEQNSLLVFNPCTPEGSEVNQTYQQMFGKFCTKRFRISLRGNFTFWGTSDPAECGTSVNRLFKQVPCPEPDDKCAFDGFYQPALQSGKFLAYSGYYFVMDFFNATFHGDIETNNVSLSRFREITTKHCLKSWNEFQSHNYTKTVLRFFAGACFNAHYIDTLLTTGYGFDLNSFHNIEFVSDDHGTSFGWALGLALNTIFVNNTKP